MVRAGLVAVARRAMARRDLRMRYRQAVAFGYEIVDDRLALRIYDPNHPDQDDVEVRFRLGIERHGPGTMLQTTGEPVHAFWLLPYRAEPVTAWR